MEVIFRGIEERDIPHIMKFFSELREEDAGVSFTEYDKDEQIREWIGNPDVFVYVAEYENKVVGVFKARREGSHKKHSAFLTAAVAKGFRGHNVAKNLTNYGISRLPEKGIAIARAYIFSDNKPSINTILSCGFQFAGSVYMHHYDEKNHRYVDDLIFHKILQIKQLMDWGIFMFEFKEFDYLTDGEIDLIIEMKSPADDKKGYVPAYIYRITLHGKPDGIGRIDVRIGHNQNTGYGGNIGYEIEEAFRGNHYAAKACKIVKQVAKGHGMDRLIITCNPDNLPSRKTCEAVGAKLKEIVDLPPNNEMYLQGEKQKCIYVWEI